MTAILQNNITLHIPTQPKNFMGDANQATLIFRPAAKGQIRDLIVLQFHAFYNVSSPDPYDIEPWLESWFNARKRYLVEIDIPAEHGGSLFYTGALKLVSYKLGLSAADKSDALRGIFNPNVTETMLLTAGVSWDAVMRSGLYLN